MQELIGVLNEWLMACLAGAGLWAAWLVGREIFGQVAETLDDFRR